VNAEVLKRNDETLVEGIPKPQLGGYAAVEPGQDGFSVGTLGCSSQAEKNLRFEVVENCSVRVGSSVMEFVNDDNVVGIGWQRLETIPVECLNRCKNVAAAAWFVSTN
jgi:hypothetical protein